MRLFINKLSGDEEGLTLVEIVVAMLLLSIGVLTAFTILVTGIRVNDINRDKTVAVNLAEEYMEDWKYRSALPANGYSDTFTETRSGKTCTVAVSLDEYFPPGTTDSMVEITVKAAVGAGESELKVVRKRP